MKNLIWISFLAIWSLMVVCVPSSIAATIAVGPTQTYTTLSAGFTVATTGDTILVYPGIYHEQISLPHAMDSVIFMAQTFGTVTIDGNPSTAAAMPNSYNNAVLTGPGATNWQVKGFVIIANGATDCLQEWNASTACLYEDCLLIGNSVAGDTTPGPAYGNILTYTGAVGLKVRHCTIVNGSNQGISHWKEAGMAGWDVRNNIFANLRIGLENANLAASNVWDGVTTNDYNLFYNVATTIVGGSGSTTGQHDLVNVNPLFVSASTDFHLQFSSPAKNAASDSTAMGARWLAPAALSISPSGTVSVSVGHVQQFTASGGGGTYTWSLSTSIYGTLNQTTGTQVTFTGTSAGTVTIRVTDGSVQVTATINVVPTSAPVAPSPDRYDLFSGIPSNVFKSNAALKSMKNME